MAAEIHGGSCEWQNKRLETEGFTGGWHFKYHLFFFFPWYIYSSAFFLQITYMFFNNYPEGFLILFAVILPHVGDWQKPWPCTTQNLSKRRIWEAQIISLWDTTLGFILGFLNTAFPTYVLTNQGFFKLFLWFLVPLKLLFCIRAEKHGETVVCLFVCFLLSTPFSFNCCNSVLWLIVKGRRNFLYSYHELGSHRTKGWAFFNLAS